MRSWQTIAEIVRIVLTWLQAVAGRKAVRLREADRMFLEGLKERDEAKVTAALERLKRERRR